VILNECHITEVVHVCSDVVSIYGESLYLFLIWYLIVENTLTVAAYIRTYTLLVLASFRSATSWSYRVFIVDWGDKLIIRLHSVYPLEIDFRIGVFLVSFAIVSFEMETTDSRILSPPVLLV